MKLLADGGSRFLRIIRQEDNTHHLPGDPDHLKLIAIYLTSALAHLLVADPETTSTIEDHPRLTAVVEEVHGTIFAPEIRLPDLPKDDQI